MLQIDRRQFGRLSCHVARNVSSSQPPRLLVVLCHGFGAPGSDLLPLGPELALEQIDLEAEYDGKPATEGAAAKVKWQAVQTSDPNGVVSLNNEIGKLKSVIGYAFAEFDSESEQEVIVKIGCINANKVWINGQLVIAEEIYHVGMDPDQFSGAAKLRQGKNQILIKVCQNDQAEPWACSLRSRGATAETTRLSMPPSRVMQKACSRVSDRPRTLPCIEPMTSGR